MPPLPQPSCREMGDREVPEADQLDRSTQQGTGTETPFSTLMEEN